MPPERGAVARATHNTITEETPVTAALTTTPIVFKTKDLSAAAQRVIDNYAKAVAEREAKVKAARQQHRANWEAKHTEGVRKVRDYLTACLKKGVPPEAAQVSTLLGASSFFSDLSNWTLDQEIKKPAPANVPECKALLELLRMHTGETISVGQLKGFGFGSKMLNRLFADIAAARK